MNSIPPTLLLFIAATAAGAAVFVAARLIEPMWDHVSARYIGDLQPMLIALGLESTRTKELMRWWGVGMIAMFLVIGAGVHMWPVACIATYLIYMSPRFYLQNLIFNRGHLLRDQMVGVVTALANATRAGLSLAQGLENIAAETPEPLATELRRIVRDYRGGRPLASALADARERLVLDSFSLFASALLVSLERGGKITEALERIDRTLQEYQRLERKLQADTESGRKVVVMLAIFPFVFLFLFYFLNPDGTTLLFTTLPGQLVLFVVIGLVYVAVRWANKIMTLQI